MSGDPEEAQDARFEALFDEFHKAVEDGDIEAEERLGAEALALAAEWADQNMSEDLQLKMMASQFEDAAEWEMAEQARLQVLRLAEACADGAREMGLYKAHDDLRGLYRLLGRNGEALDHARKSVEAARPAEMDVLLGMALAGLVAAERIAGNHDRALEAANEWLNTCGNERMHDLSRAQALVARAGCSIRIGDLERAEEDLNAASPLLTPKSGAAMMAGVQNTLAGWWETYAAYEQAKGNLDAAAKAYESVVAFRRNVAMAPQLSGPYARAGLARSLGRYSEALRYAGRDLEAEQARAEAETIWDGIRLPDGAREDRTQNNRGL